MSSCACVPRNWRYARATSADRATRAASRSYTVASKAAAAPSRDRRARPHRSSSQLASNPNCQKSLALVGAPSAANLPCSLRARSEEHTSELQSLMRISYAVFCLKKKIQKLLDHSYTLYHITQ